MVILCTDCKYYRGREDSRECRHPISNYEINPVTGRKHFRECEFMRKVWFGSNPSNESGQCGPDAKLFEPKKAWWKLW
jgi:hypothetical protein